MNVNSILVALFFLNYNLVISQIPIIKQPLAGKAIIKTTSIDSNSKDSTKNVLNVSYYCNNNDLIYYLSDHEFSRIKIGSNQYSLMHNVKKYTYNDTIVDLEMSTSFVFNFIDSLFLFKSLEDKDLKITDITQNNISYSKLLFNEQIDSVNTGNNIKIPMSATFKGEYFINKNNGQLQIIKENFKSLPISYFTRKDLVSLEECNKDSIQNLINNKLNYYLGSYTCTTLSALNSHSELKSINLNVKNEEIKKLQFNLTKSQKLLFKNIKQKYILVDFWYPSCYPCLKSIPDLNKINKELGDKIKVIGIDCQTKDLNFLTSFCKKKNITYSVAVDSKKIINNLFKINIYPSWILFDNAGNIIDYSSGFKEGLFERINAKVFTESK